MPFVSFFQRCYFEIPLIINAKKLFFPYNCGLKHGGGGGVAQCGKTGTYSRNFPGIYYNVNKHCRINQLTKFYRRVAARCFQLQTWLGWHRERFTHGKLTSGQMRETYSFGTYRSISCHFFLSIRFHYLFLQLERGKGEPLLLLCDSVKRFFGLVYSRRKWRGGGIRVRLVRASAVRPW